MSQTSCWKPERKYPSPATSETHPKPAWAKTQYSVMKSRPDSVREHIQISPEVWKASPESCQELISSYQAPSCLDSSLYLFSLPTAHSSLLSHSFVPQITGQAAPQALLGSTGLPTAQFQTESIGLALLESGAYVWPNQLWLKRVGGVRNSIKGAAGLSLVMGVGKKSSLSFGWVNALAGGLASLSRLCTTCIS